MFIRTLIKLRFRYVNVKNTNKLLPRHLSNQNTEKTNITKPEENHNFGSLNNLENALKKLLHSTKKYYSWKGKFTFGIFVAVISGGSYLYFVRDSMRSLVVDEVSTVASKSLEDDKLQNNAEQLSKLVVNNILHDQEIKQQTEIFLRSILLSEETKDSLSELLLSVIQKEEFVEYVATKLKEILLGILEAEDTRIVVMSQVELILQDPGIKLSVENLINNVTTTEEVKIMLAEFFKSVLASKLVHDQGSELGRQITTDVITDADVQQEAGKALWAAIARSVTPSYFNSKK